MRELAVNEREEFAEFFGTIFGSLPRSDQRSAAESYVLGLLHAGGRKSIQRIADEVGGPHNGQSLQQFVNQSRWDPRPVRRTVADVLSACAPPAAWLVEEVAFAKHGRWSAGVERQYVRGLGRTVNCQVGAAVLMTTGEAAVPVNWRLCLPKSWEADHDRRTKAHVPDQERHRSFGEHVIDLVDDLTLDWGTPVAPLVADLTHVRGVADLLRGLEDRGLDYVVEVDPRHRVRASVSVVRGGGPRGQVPLAGSAQAVAGLERRTVAWGEGPRGRSLRSQFVTLPVADEQARSRRLLVEWPLGRPRPRAFWLTNMSVPAQELVALAKTRWRAAHAIGELAGGFGLFDYEGRSFHGWHHHVTLASAAYAFDVRWRLAAGDEAALLPA
ncbi:IS701 family transposase [Nonomuraea sp. WAC 01424]|uniref:IS701 family transposase n=1 Tax=Nonomuraea sp. WAC 01424 TaxID=2203200 RepID=UPI000F7A6251|nr:IS701 family transposase [Nonomuraea sp. WAC 01424]RSN05829.1 IS701 family transposase [Nonomuraea sp. WAC 01424]